MIRKRRGALIHSKMYSHPKSLPRPASRLTVLEQLEGRILLASDALPGLSSWVSANVNDDEILHHGDFSSISDDLSEVSVGSNWAGDFSVNYGDSPIYADANMDEDRSLADAHLLLEDFDQPDVPMVATSAGQNPLLPGDVSGDNFLAPNDLLLIASELLRTGVRSLVEEPQIVGNQAAGGDRAEEENTVYLDVNGDHYLTAADVLHVARMLHDSAETDIVQMRFEIADVPGAAGTSIDNVRVGESFALNVFVQDIRPDTVVDRGVFSSFLDVFYDGPLVSVAGPVEFGENYGFLPDQSDQTISGEIQDIGNAQSDFGIGGPTGPDEFLLFSVPFSTDNAPIDAVDDDAGTDAALRLPDDSPAVILNVLANDTLGGRTELRGASAENPPLTDVFVFSDPFNAVPPEFIVYGSDMLDINSTGSLVITDVGPTSNGGIVDIVSAGTRIEYVPPTGAEVLKEGETATDSFNYTIRDEFGLVNTSATVTVTMVGTNDGPVANPDGGVEYTTDANTALTTGSVLENDTDVDGDPLEVSDFDTTNTHGVVANNGDGTFHYDPNGKFEMLGVGDSAADSFEYTISDGQSGTDTAIVTITIHGVNDSPVAHDDEGLGFTTYQDFAFVTDSVLVNDTDIDGESLSVSDFNIDGTLGRVTNNANGTFNYDPNDEFDSLGSGQSATDTFVYEVSDGQGGTDTATVTITIRGENNPPVADDDAGEGFTTDEDSAFVTASVLDNDGDSDGGSLAVITFHRNGTIGEVANNGDGTFNYNPNGQFEELKNGESTTDTFVYTISDGQGGTDTARVTIAIDGVNDAPVARNDVGIGFKTYPDAAFTTNHVLANDTDADNDELSISDPDITGTLGLVTRSGDGAFEYDPNGQFDFLTPGQIATDSFTYTVSDGNGGSDTATVTITVIGSVATGTVFFRLETTDLQGTPIFQVMTGESFLLNGLVQDIRTPDVPNTRGVFQAFVDVTFDESFAMPTGSFTFGPAYQEQTDGSLVTPGLLDEVGGTQTGFGFAPPFDFPLGSDEFPLFSLVFEATDAGTVTFATDAADFAVVHDVLLFDSPSSFLPLEEIFFGTSILTINAAPVLANSDGLTVDEDSRDNFVDVLANDEVPSGGTLTITDVELIDQGGTVVNNGDHLLYTPLGDFAGTETFVYTVSDGLGNSDQTSVVVTVVGLPDNPVANNDGGAEYTTDEDTAFTTGNVLDNDTDSDGDFLSVVTVDPGGMLGRVTDQGDGTFDYDPDGQFEDLRSGETATDSFTYTVDDGNGGTDSATVTITITGVNDAPVAADDLGSGYTTDEETAIVTGNVLENDTDADDGILSIDSFFDPSGMRGVVTSNGNGTFNYDPNGQFEELAIGESATDTFEYRITDGNGGFDTAMVMITIDGLNSNPIAVDDSGLGFTTDRDSPFVTGNVLDNDSDVDRDSLAVVTFDTSGTLGVITDNGDGTFFYDPNGEFDLLGLREMGTDVFTYTVTDGNGGTDTATVTVTVSGADLDDSVFFRLATTDLSGEMISNVEQNREFLLNVFVQDIRRDTVAKQGVFQAYLDVMFDAALVTATGGFTFGENYLEVTSGSLATPGFIDEAGGTQTGFGLLPHEHGLPGPLGAGEFLLFSIPFEADSPGTVVFTGDPADLADFHDVTLFEPTSTVLHEDIVYGAATLIVDPALVVANEDPDVSANPSDWRTDEDAPFTTGDVLANDIDADGDPLEVSDFDTTNTHGVVTNNGDGTFHYDPNGQFEFLQEGETATDSFAYTATDGENTGTSNVIITIDGRNDAPVANDDTGAEYATNEETAFTTGNILDNDTDVEGDSLTVTVVDTSGIQGSLTDNGDGTFDYDPNGQFNSLSPGETTTDTFTYRVEDGRNGVSEATVTITVVGVAPIPGDFMGVVYVDVDDDGFKDDMERAVGDVEIRMEGVDVFGTPVLLSTRTNARGEFGFLSVTAGNYDLFQVQPNFYLDGKDTINGVLHTGMNDHVSIDTSETSAAQMMVSFGERSLHPEFINLADVLNTSLREGIVVGFDAAGNQLWYSPMNGWDGVEAVQVTFLAGGSAAHLAVTLDSGSEMTYLVPTLPTAGYFRVKGETSQGSVVQFVGTMDDFQPLVSSLTAVDALFAEWGQ